MTKRLSTFSAGPVNTSRAAATVRHWIRQQVAYHRDFYWTDYQTGEGHILELVVAPVKSQHSWNHALPTSGRRRYQIGDIQVTLTKRDDGLVHIRLCYNGPDESMSQFRQVAAKLIPVERIDGGRRFRAQVLKVKYWRPQPWHCFSPQDVAVV